MSKEALVLVLVVGAIAVGIVVVVQKVSSNKGDWDAYGAVDPAAQMEVAKSALPSNISIGSTLSARDPNGRVRTATVKAIKDQTVVLDLNHPLAGKTLVFEVKVVGVEPPGAAPDVKAAPRAPAPPKTQTK